MAPRFVATILKNRLLMWLVFAVYFAIFLGLNAISTTLGDVVLIAGFIALAVVFVKVRPRSGKWSFSTHCQQCDASLQGVGGFPRPTCAECGHRQSWASNKE